MRQDVLLLASVGATQPQIDHAFHSRARQRLAPHRVEHFGLVALRQPHDLPRCRGRQQSHAQLIARLGTEALELLYGNRTVCSRHRRNRCQERDHEIIIPEMLTGVKRNLPQWDDFFFCNQFLSFFHLHTSVRRFGFSVPLSTALVREWEPANVLSFCSVDS
jgi:hypothetical protein